MLNRILLQAFSVFVLSACYLIVVSPLFSEDTMYSETFEIDLPNVNLGSGDIESDSFNLSTTLGQTAAGQFVSDGYVVRAGFQYIHSIIPFTFTISDTSINLGTLTPQTPATETADLTVSFGSAGLYQVTASEQRSLTSTSGLSTISDTECDPADTCTTVAAKPWTSTSSYGFGYSLSGDDIPQDFEDNTHYRPFPNASADNQPVVVMTNQNVTLNPEASPRNTHRSTVQFKVNVSPVQPAGTYQTIIDFVAVPSY